MNFKELAQKYDTPLYVYDFNHFEKQYNELKEAFKARQKKHNSLRGKSKFEPIGN